MVLIIIAGARIFGLILSIERIAMKALPFIAVEIGMLLLITYIPTIALILPKLFEFH